MKQIGVIKFDGTNGDLTFYKGRRGGYRIKSKSVIPAGRIANDPAFVRTRENMGAFRRATKAGKLLRHAIPTLLSEAKDGQVSTRVMKVMSAIIRTDTINPRPDRNVASGDLTLLQDFDFNSNAPIGTVLQTENTVTVDRTLGTIQVTVPAFVPEKVLASPTGATHYMIVSAGLEINFATDVVVAKQLNASAYLPIDSTPSAILTQSAALTAGTTLPLFMVLGVQFFQEVNGIKYPLNNAANNGLGIVKVSVV